MDQNTELHNVLTDITGTLNSIGTRLDRIEERLTSMDHQLEDLIREAHRPWSAAA